MSIFGKKKSELDHRPGGILAVEPDEVVDFDSVLAFMVGLNQSDFDKLHRVANIYRAADRNANKVLGIKKEPAPSVLQLQTVDIAEKGIKPGKSELEVDGDIADEMLVDDELEAAFAGKDPKKSKSKKGGR